MTDAQPAHCRCTAAELPVHGERTTSTLSVRGERQTCTLPMHGEAQPAVYAKFSDETRKPLKLNLKSEKMFVMAGRRTLFFCKKRCFSH